MNIDLENITKVRIIPHFKLLMLFLLIFAKGVFWIFWSFIFLYKWRNFSYILVNLSSKARLFPNFLIVLFYCVLLKLFLPYFLFLKNLFSYLSSLSS